MNVSWCSGQSHQGIEFDLGFLDAQKKPQEVLQAAIELMNKSVKLSTKRFRKASCVKEQ